KTKFIFTLPPVIANGVIIPLVLRFAYGVPDAYWFLVVTVCVGEVISVCILGMILKAALWPQRFFIFRNTEENNNN
ncbi:MAG: QueT transporter family protein, partial [Pseudobutyrivibrio sp.]|nr:QueT transporter family protein [Pseudobutyrivibrio sp.]